MSLKVLEQNRAMEYVILILRGGGFKLIPSCKKVACNSLLGVLNTVLRL
jgi:hypothetical protein